MHFPWLILGVLLMTTHARAETTTVTNGNNFASVTQSGDPATTTRKIEKRPGYTRIEQQSGGNRSVVVQSNDPADMPKMKMPEMKMPKNFPGFSQEFLDTLPPEARDLFKR